MLNVEQTIISQYANSPTIVRLIEDMNEYIDPRADIELFYSTVLDIDTCNDYGLMCWGKIVNISRVVAGVELGTEEYRTLIKIKALANISDTSIPSINTILRKIYKDKGRCYVMDNGRMDISYVFEFEPSAIDLALLETVGLLPRPTGVNVRLNIQAGNMFGFSEAGLQPFGQAPFRNHEVINI